MTHIDSWLDWDTMQYPWSTDVRFLLNEYEMQGCSCWLFVLSITDNLVRVWVEVTTMAINHLCSVPTNIFRSATAKTGMQHSGVLWDCLKVFGNWEVWMTTFYVLNESLAHAWPGRSWKHFLKSSAWLTNTTWWWVPSQFPQFWACNWNERDRLTAQEWIFPPCTSGSFHRPIPAKVNKLG